jgi:hypothetical protein
MAPCQKGGGTLSRFVGGIYTPMFAKVRSNPLQSEHCLSFVHRHAACTGSQHTGAVPRARPSAKHLPTGKKPKNKNPRSDESVRPRIPLLDLEPQISEITQNGAFLERSPKTGLGSFWNLGVFRARFFLRAGRPNGTKLDQSYQNTVGRVYIRSNEARFREVPPTHSMALARRGSEADPL